MDIVKQIKNLKPKLTKLEKSCKEDLDKIKGDIERLVEVSSDFGNNWIGTWASPNYNLYNNFTGGNGETIVLTEDEIQSYTEEKSGVTFKSIKEIIPGLMKANRDFQEEIVTELSLIKGNDNLVSENELLDKIENQEWGVMPQKFVRMRSPKSVYTYDPAQLLNKGLDTPPHLNIDAELMANFSMVASVEDFQKNAKRLLRQLELKFSISDDFEAIPEISLNFIYLLIERFHIVANQLRNRYSNRDTLQIADEYDVQDLLHSLLKIQFEDVRAEEYTPSYAGSSTRVDFLLKREQIVIELKKTREELKDKQVGDQLILDTQHYKAHPDCKHLICFVYDPEGRIENPRGLESDLNTISSDELMVEVFIRP